MMAVPILPNDTAKEVFDKVLVVAELVLHRAIPLLLAGTAHHTLMVLSQGSYFSGQNAEDGRVDRGIATLQIYNLVRAVTRPYPGAFADTQKGRLVVWRTILCDDDVQNIMTGSALFMWNKKLYIWTGHGGMLRALDIELNGETLISIDETMTLSS